MTMSAPAPTISTSAPPSLPRSLGELRASGWVDRSVREELRDNLVARLRDGRPAVDGLVGYDDSVLPALERALLAGHGLLVVGERGQAKSRILRGLAQLLDEWMPYVAGCELHSSPDRPLTPHARGMVSGRGDGTPIEWLHRDQRFLEKLATPDTSVADLLGDIDPVKVAEGRHLSDEASMHFGMLPRANRGILAVNELPDLPERIQVALLNALEERDVQVRGYPMRLPVDVLVAATANPDDYTSGGRIITPLKDRLGAQVATHYPRTVDEELAIVQQEARPETSGLNLHVPDFLLRVLATTAQDLRSREDVDQTSGVSVRFTIGAYETMVAGAVRRAIRTGATSAVPRVVDLWPVVEASLSRVEVDSYEPGGAHKVLDDALRRSLLSVWSEQLGDADMNWLMLRFEELGLVVETGPLVPSGQLLAQFGENVDGLSEWVDALGVERSDMATLASVIEFVLEGLHLTRRLSKVSHTGRVVFSA